MPRQRKLKFSPTSSVCALFLKQLWLCRRSRSHGHFGVGGPDQAGAAVTHAKAQVVVAGLQLDGLLAWKRILHHLGKRVWLKGSLHSCSDAAHQLAFGGKSLDGAFKLSMVQSVTQALKADGVGIDAEIYSHGFRRGLRGRHYQRVKRKAGGYRRIRAQRQGKSGVLLLLVFLRKQRGINRVIAQAVTQLYSGPVHLYVDFAKLAVPVFVLRIICQRVIG